MGAVTTRVSLFGRVNMTFYSLLKFLNEKDGENLEVCDFGCLDGLHTIPFLKKGYLVDTFDMNEIYLYGGVCGVDKECKFAQSSRIFSQNGNVPALTANDTADSCKIAVKED